MKRLIYSNCLAGVHSGLLSFIILTGCTTERPSQIDYLGQDPPNTSAEIFAPGLISTDSFEHSSPAFSPDGNVVLWTVVSKNYRASLREMKKDGGKWTKPQKPSFADSTADDTILPFLPMVKNCTLVREEDYQTHMPTVRILEFGWLTEMLMAGAFLCRLTQ